MKRRFLAKMLAILTAVFSYLTVSAQEPQAAKILFHEGLHLEEVKGELEQAIAVYQKVIEEFPSERSVAARAQLHIGICYEKLGKEKAVEAYERILEEYGDQREVVVEARARLAALRQPISPGMVLRRVWQVDPSYGSDLLGSLSMDGRYLSYVDWETGDLAVRDLTTGKNRRLTDKGSWFESSEFAEASIISPDAKHIAYAWVNKENIYDLRVVGSDGSEPRVLFSREGSYVRPFQWSPDGKDILALFSHKEGTVQGVLVSMDGSIHVLKTWVWGGGPQKMSFSPDRHYIIFDVLTQVEPANRDIFLLSLDGGREIPLVEHPANDYVLGWSPDGEWILFVSDRTGTLSAWMIKVGDGQPQGDPVLVRRDIGDVRPMGFTQDGSYYFGLESSISDVYIVTVDSVTGDVVDTPSQVTKHRVGDNFASTWSPNGKSIAYLSHSKMESGFLAYTRRGRDVLVIHSLETGEERELVPELRKLMLLDPSLPRWSPDGRSILVAGEDMNGFSGLYLIDVETGDITAVIQNKPRWRSSYPVWVPDGRRIIYVRKPWTDLGARILMYDLETGQVRELYHLSEKHILVSMGLSPDGRQLAFNIGRNALLVMPTAGGEPRELFRFTLEERTNAPDNLFVEWTADGKYLLFSKRESELWRIPVDGGEPERLGLTMERLRELRVDPQGQYLSFISGPVKSELWVMRNFLPESEASR